MCIERIEPESAPRVDFLPASTVFMVLGAIIGLLLVGCGCYWLVNHVLVKPLQRRRRRERRKHKREAKRQASAEGAGTTSTVLVAQSQQGAEQESSSGSDSSDDSEAELPVAFFADDPLLDDQNACAAGAASVDEFPPSTAPCCSKSVIGPASENGACEAPCCSSVICQAQAPEPFVSELSDASGSRSGSGSANGKPRRTPIVRFDVDSSAPPPPPRQYPPLPPAYAQTSVATSNSMPTTAAAAQELETQLDGRACITTRAVVETPPTNSPHLRSYTCPEEFEIPLTV